MTGCPGDDCEMQFRCEANETGVIVLSGLGCNGLICNAGLTASKRRECRMHTLAVLNCTSDSRLAVLTVAPQPSYPLNDTLSCYLHKNGDADGQVLIDSFDLLGTCALCILIVITVMLAKHRHMITVIILIAKICWSMCVRVHM